MAQVVGGHRIGDFIKRRSQLADDLIQRAETAILIPPRNLRQADFANRRHGLERKSPLDSITAGVFELLQPVDLMQKRRELEGDGARIGFVGE